MSVNTEFRSAATYQATADLERFQRVFALGETCRPASEDELEIGVCTRKFVAGDWAAVHLVQLGARQTYIASTSITAGVTVFRAPNGRVSSAGESRLGRAAHACIAGEVVDVFVEYGSRAGSGGGDPDPVPAEVLLNAGALSGPSGDFKLGYDQVNQVLYYASTGGVWVQHPEPQPNVAEDYIHLQPTPAAVWTIIHNFAAQGRTLDDVTIYDASNRKVFASVANPSGDQTVITFDGPTAGWANLEYH